MINEASPNTFEGSISNDMLLSRVWISKRLRDTGIPIKSCIVLGSWYGILPFVLNRFNKIPKIYANDIDSKYIEVSKKINPTIKHITGDCNQLKYKNIDCVINPSTNDIVNRGWFERIPNNTLCLFQIGDGITKGCPNNLKTLKEMYPVKKILLQDTLSSKDIDGKIKRFLLIGKK